MSTETLVLAGAGVETESVLATLSTRTAALDGRITFEMVVPAAGEGVSGSSHRALALELMVLHRAGGTLATT